MEVSRRRFSPWTQLLLLWGGSAAVAIFAFVLILPFFVQYDLTFVHPHRSEIHLHDFVQAVGLQWQDIISPFKFTNEFRARFVAYWIIILDLKLRMSMYPWFVLPPAFSIAWIFQVWGVYLLYRLVSELTSNRMAAFLATLVYVTSTGFLSGFTMYFTAGKSLFGPIYLLLILMMFRAQRGAGPRRTFDQLDRAATFKIAGIIFLGLMTDESAFFCLILLPIMYPERFIRWPLKRMDIIPLVRTGLYYGIPVFLFLAFVLFVAPIITRAFFGFKFDYLATLLGYRAVEGNSSMVAGPYGGFTLTSLFFNFLTMIGISLVPWQISPLVSRPGSGGVLSGQVVNVWLCFVVFSAVAGAVWLAVRSRLSSRHFFRRLLVASGLFIAFQSALNGRHVPFITGFYYGAPFSVFFSLLVGVGLATVMPFDAWRRWISICVVAIIIAVQVDNFRLINGSMLEVHNEQMSRSLYASKMPLVGDARGVTAAELEAIREAWTLGGLETYLKVHPVSTGAAFLVEELRWLDHIRTQS